jgi:hypothetical protein
MRELTDLQVDDYKATQPTVEDEKAYGEKRLLRFYDVLPDSEKEEKIAAAK